MNKKQSCKQLNYETIKTTPYAQTCIKPPRFLHKHAFFEISFVVKGSCINVINGKKVHFSRNSCVILSPNDEHYFDYALDEKNKNFTNAFVLQLKNYLHADVYVSVEKMKEICDMMANDLYAQLTDSSKIHIFNLPDDFLAFYTQKIYNFSFPKNNFSESSHTSIVCAILAEYLESLDSTKQNRPEWLKKLLVMLNDVKYLTMSEQQIAQEIGYSTAHFSREFKKHMQMPYIKFLIKKKLAYSINLILADNKIIYISEELGFKSPGLFAKYFCAEYGCSPLQFKKQHYINKQN